VGLVTNGSPSQARKVEVAGIGELLDAVCISEVEAVSKPDPGLFQLAAERCGVPLDGWMVGDHPQADIGGGRAAGLRTIWLRRGREWTEPAFRPDVTADSLEEALAFLVESG
jgi:putative hydrolase of the HAD superfamily